ncbi:MAG: hypothetical protein JRI23_15175 [Deltaproteobacteria bacterium]|jgi:hypothetical protein|nr:hypothetical protein [Deltaproteobacteria bacterium]MBW2533090.1 hypothetical protein [Deltaproteobacteria bacterium]
MAYVNPATKEINIKLVALVPPADLARWRDFHDSLVEEGRGERREVELESGALLSFDFGPPLGLIRGYGVRLHVFVSTAASQRDLDLLGRGASVVIVVAGAPGGATVAGVLGPDVEIQHAAPADQVAHLLKMAARAALIQIRDAPADAPAGSARRGEAPLDGQYLDVGPYRFLIPEIVAEARAIDEPPIHRLDGVFLNQVSLTFGAALDRGAPEEVDRFIASGVESLGGSHEAIGLTLEGIELHGIRCTDCEGFDPQPRFVESFAGICGPDLVFFTIVYGGDPQTDASIRQLYLSMIGTAMVRRMHGAPEHFPA